MLTFYQKYSKTVFDISLIILTVFLIMWLFSFLYKIATPIFLAFLIFLVIEPLARFLHKRGIKKSIATGISILLFAIVILGVLVGAGAIFITQIDTMIEKIPAYSDIFHEQLVEKTAYLETQFESMPPEITEKVSEYSALITEKLAGFTKWFLALLLSFLTSFTAFIVNFLIGIILAYFLSVEIDFWRKAAKEKTPKTFKTAFYFLKENVLKGISGYLKAQMKLISISFVIIYISLLVLQVDNAFSISVLAAFFDILPLLGVSTIFLPWIIYLFIVGNTNLAIWLLVVLGIVIAVRQILEPKITGDSLGVSAFTMLAFMIISLSLFGVAGLILSPILIILIKALHEKGYLKSWIRLPEDEYDKTDTV